MAEGVGEEGAAMTSMESPRHASSVGAAKARPVAADESFVAATPVCLDAVQKGLEGEEMRESGQMTDSGTR